MENWYYRSTLLDLVTDFPASRRHLFAVRQAGIKLYTFVDMVTILTGRSLPITQRVTCFPGIIANLWSDRSSVGINRLRGFGATGPWAD